jgi:thiamine-monophosphate kinase
MGLALAADPRVHALMDISDGISKECRTLAFDNKLAIELEADPACISPAVKELGTRLGTGWREWYLDGGEDYELLFAAGRSFDPGPLAARHGVPLTRIGSFVRQRGRAQVSIAGAIAGAGGWDHLRKNLL